MTATEPSPYHDIMKFAMSGKDVLSQEHNAVLTAFARSPRLQSAAAAALALKGDDCTQAAMVFALKFGDRDLICRVDRLAREVEILEVLCGKAAIGRGYISFTGAMLALVP